MKSNYARDPNFKIEEFSATITIPCLIKVVQLKQIPWHCFNVILTSHLLSPEKLLERVAILGLLLFANIKQSVFLVQLVRIQFLFCRIKFKPAVQVYMFIYLDGHYKDWMHM